MTLNISVKHNIKEMTKTLNRRQRKELPKVITTALNKTVASVKVRVAKDITKATGITAGVVKRGLDVDKANRTTRTATITAATRTPNLIRFATQAAIRTYRKGPGLKAKAWSKKARVFPHVFVGNSGRTAFVRQSKNRLDIVPVRGPSIPRAMVSAKIAKRTRKWIPARWKRTFTHEFNRKFGK